MSENLYLQYNAADTGDRSNQNPLTTNFWTSPAVTLANGTDLYRLGQMEPISVQVSLKSPISQPEYLAINVEVWVGDPTTVITPTTAFEPFSPDPSGQRVLTGEYPVPAGEAIDTVPVIQVTGFEPYPGISSLPAGHCCLIANCYATMTPTSPPITDGVSRAGGADALTDLVKTDQHVAQHNIFAATSQNMVIIFPFRAATPLSEGAERVRLEIVDTPPDQLQTILQARQGELQGAQFTGLPLTVSERPTKAIRLTGGGPRRRCCRWFRWCCGWWRQWWMPKEKRVIELGLEAHKSKVLTITVELDPAEKPGAAHAFDIVQRDAHGSVQGGFRLVTVARD